LLKSESDIEKSKSPLSFRDQQLRLERGHAIFNPLVANQDNRVCTVECGQTSMEKSKTTWDS
jgi:hypothetical protein